MSANRLYNVINHFTGDVIERGLTDIEATNCERKSKWVCDIVEMTADEYNAWNTSNIAIEATQQGLYSVSVDGRQRAIISNSVGKDGRRSGVWYMREMDGRDLVEGREPVNVTAILHNTDKLNAAIKTYLNL